MPVSPQAQDRTSKLVMLLRFLLPPQRNLAGQRRPSPPPVLAALARGWIGRNSQDGYPDRSEWELYATDAGPHGISCSILFRCSTSDLPTASLDKRRGISSASRSGFKRGHRRGASSPDGVARRPQLDVKAVTGISPIG